MGLTQNQQEELDMQIELLQGEICGMCITDNVDELNKLYDYAKKRLVAILLANVERLKVQRDENG